jgi:hypothetical protein
MRKPKLRPYVMRGAPKVTEERATSVDPPDHRVPESRPRKMTPKELAAIPIDWAVPPRLRVVDRCFVRWAATPIADDGGTSIASLVLIRREGDSGPSPLDDAESKILDAAVRASPVWAHRFVMMYYRRGLSVPEIAVELAMKRREYVYAERDLVLYYYLGRLHEIGFSLASQA